MSDTLNRGADQMKKLTEIAKGIAGKDHSMLFIVRPEIGSHDKLDASKTVMEIKAGTVGDLLELTLLNLTVAAEIIAINGDPRGQSAAEALEKAIMLIEPVAGIHRAPAA